MDFKQLLELAKNALDNDMVSDFLIKTATPAVKELADDKLKKALDQVFVFYDSLKALVDKSPTKVDDALLKASLESTKALLTNALEEIDRRLSN